MSTNYVTSQEIMLYIVNQQIMLRVHFKSNQAVYTANTLLDCYLDIMFGELENLEKMNSPYISIKHF